MDNRKIIAAIERSAKNKHMSLAAMCRKADISYESFRLLKNNAGRDILLGTLLKICRALEVKPATILKGVE